MNKRSSGILMHISSLPGKYGIGDFGEGAYRFVDFLHKANQKNWQILPLGVTGFGDSPYQCFSAFAGNPYFIDLDEFLGLNYLKQEDIDNYRLNKVNNKVDYGLLFENKMALLRTAYKNARSDLLDKLENFYVANLDWLREFCLFMSIKTKNQNKSWYDWDIAYKRYDSDRVLNFESENQDEVYFWVFTQYYFFRQWKRLKKYANKKRFTHLCI